MSLKGWPVAGLIVALLSALPVGAQPPAIKTLPLENEYIRVVVNCGPQEAGRFSIRTTGGDPARAESQNQPLIYGGNAPGTSYTTVRVDGNNYLFGGKSQRRAGNGVPTGSQVGDVTNDNGKLLTTYAYGDIEITEELAIVRSLYSRMLDSVGITYRMTNKGTDAHQVGLRLMLDTMCGKNDGAAIRPSGMSAITLATQLTGEKIPEFFQAFDSLASPVVIAQGTLRGGTNTPPDKVLFADWGTLADNPWNVTLTPGQAFIRAGEDSPDTAAALYWNPVTLEPGQTTAYSTTYGMGSVNVKIGGLTTGLTCQSSASYNYERTESFNILGYVENTKDFEARNVTMTLTLPAGLTLVGGSKLRRDYGSIKPGDPANQETWLVRANGVVGGEQTVTLDITSDNLEAVSVKRVIDITVPTTHLVFTPDQTTLPLQTNGVPTIVPLQVAVSPAETLMGVQLTLAYDPKILRAFDVSRGRTFVEDNALLPDWTFTLDGAGPGTVVIHANRGTKFPLTQAEAHVATVLFYVVGAGKCDIRATESKCIREGGIVNDLATTPSHITIVPATH